MTDDPEHAIGRSLHRLAGALTNPEETARLLGVYARTFRRYIGRHEEEDLEGLIGKRLSQISHQRVPINEVIRLEALYRERHDSWSVTKKPQQ